ncbi:RsmB/NOP family class I SAM-dependent RNA methyltransferase [Massilia sp. W12]|uniref:RsmB/NOP family class I SAM-dependent RNA methyltransferase n=1 Tax=Massilia sp. W12 TaxID=3126507 RepID=UPI0030D5129C
MRLPPAVINHTENALREVLRFTGPADVVLSHYLRANPKLGGRERGAIAEAVYVVLRHKALYTEFATHGKTTMRQLALLGLAEYAGLDALGSVSEEEAAFVNSVRATDQNLLPARIRANLPQWLFDKLCAQFGQEQCLVAAQAMNQAAPLDLRVNVLKTTRDAALAALTESGIVATLTPFSNTGLRLQKKPALQNLPLFKDGSIEVQDEGSQLLAQLLAPKRGEMVADFCAGAGGKTLALGAMMRNTGRLYAFDVSEKRLSKLKPRLARSGLSNVHPVQIAHERDAKIKRLAGKLDRVLVDAPCSGLGTLRRNPDVKWRQNEEGLAELAVKQRAILDAAARLVKSGGRLVYATCSLLDEENEAVVQDFLASHPDFTLLPAAQILAEQKIALEMGDYLKLLPHVHQTDGFFAAVLQRNGKPHTAQEDESA